MLEREKLREREHITKSILEKINMVRDVNYVLLKREKDRGEEK